MTTATWARSPLGVGVDVAVHVDDVEQLLEVVGGDVSLGDELLLALVLPGALPVGICRGGLGGVLLVGALGGGAVHDILSGGLVDQFLVLGALAHESSS